MDEYSPIVCIGVMVADLIGGPLERMPDPGGLVLVDRMGLYPGGGAVNTAIALASLGIKVQLVGKLGKDTLGGFLIEQLDSRGVGTQNIAFDPQLSTSATMVMVDPTGDRRFVHFMGANRAFTLEDIHGDVVKEASMVHVAGAFVMPALDGKPTADLLRESKRAGAVNSLDTAWDDSGSWLRTLEPVLPHVDYFLPSRVEATAMTGRDDPVEAARYLLEYGIGAVVVKCAADGCVIVTHSGDMLHVPAFEVEVVDATGAGDAFNAGFIAGIHRGYSLEESARLANALGALCVTKYGAAGGLRSLQEIMTFMMETPQKIPSYNNAQI